MGKLTAESRKPTHASHIRRQIEFTTVDESGIEDRIAPSTIIPVALDRRTLSREAREKSTRSTHHLGPTRTERVSRSLRRFCENLQSQYPPTLMRTKAKGRSNGRSGTWPRVESRTIQPPQISHKTPNPRYCQAGTGRRTRPSTAETASSYRTPSSPPSHGCQYGPNTATASTTIPTTSINSPADWAAFTRFTLRGDRKKRGGTRNTTQPKTINPKPILSQPRSALLGTRPADEVGTGSTTCAIAGRVLTAP